jgi:hypothetical protein
MVLAAACGRQVHVVQQCVLVWAFCCQKWLCRWHLAACVSLWGVLQPPLVVPVAAGSGYRVQQLQRGAC